MQIRQPSWWAAALLLLLPLPNLGCSAESGPGAPIGGPPVDPNLPAPGGGAGGSTDNAAPNVGGADGGNATGGAPDAVVPVDAPNAAYIRRLTHVEYDNTIVDLLGVDTNPSSNFQSDLAQEGFTNNSAAQNVSPTLAEQYVVAAEAISEAATANLTELLGCDAGAVGEETCARGFISSFGKRAWRRPLSVEEEERIFQLFSKARAEFEFETSIQMVIQVFLQSPQFLYLVEPNPVGVAPGQVVALNGFEVATRLSYFLLGSMPDEALFEAAETGRLDTAEGIAVEARRLLTLPRARARVGQFFTEWLRLRNIERMQKDAAMFPNYDLSLAPLMLEQVLRFTQDIILDQDGTAMDLLTASYSFASPELAPLYGLDLSSTPAGQFVRVEFDPNQRAGLLTHVALLAKLAHINQTDPVHRGKFVRTDILCGDIPPPPPDAVINVPVVEPGATTRERFARHQEDPNCRACHLFMDPIGLGFENYDALGQWRVQDNGLPIDATGEIVGTDVEGAFDGAVQLTKKLAQSEETMECMARTWLRFALGRSDSEADAGAIAAVGSQFEANGFVMKELLVALTQTNTFRQQLVLDPNTSSLGQETP